jgi:hypothetical protein
MEPEGGVPRHPSQGVRVVGAEVEQRRAAPVVGVGYDAGWPDDVGERSPEAVAVGPPAYRARVESCCGGRRGQPDRRAGRPAGVVPRSPCTHGASLIRPQREPASDRCEPVGNHRRLGRRTGPPPPTPAGRSGRGHPAARPSTTTGEACGAAGSRRTRGHTVPTPGYRRVGWRAADERGSTRAGAGRRWPGRAGCGRAGRRGRSRAAAGGHRSGRAGRRDPGGPAPQLRRPPPWAGASRVLPSGTDQKSIPPMPWS